MTFIPTTANCDHYMAEREGKYEYRAIRYRAAIRAMFAHGLDDSMTIVDVGAGMTEFDYCLRAEFNWRGRYIPVDGGIDGTDIRTWSPRSAHWFVALEILEHLENWLDVVNRMKGAATKGIVMSTPDPRACDVLAMDPTHVTALDYMDLEARQFDVSYHLFYGGTYGQTRSKTDALMGVWTK